MSTTPTPSMEAPTASGTVASKPVRANSPSAALAVAPVPAVTALLGSAARGSDGLEEAEM